MATKDFGAIADDYTFFMTHATEAEQDAAAYREQLADLRQRHAPFRLLDFGCGTGEFSARYLSLLGWPASDVELTLIEPVAQQRLSAIERLSPFSQHLPRGASSLAELEAAQFDIIVANHSLYYVHDLSQTLVQMFDRLSPGGRQHLAIAGWDNVLLQFWKVGFGLLQRDVPYYAAEDVVDWFETHAIRYRRFAVPYRLRFADTSENRLRILRFLFGEYLTEISPACLLPEFDRYVAEDCIDIETSSVHVVIDRLQD